MLLFKWLLRKEGGDCWWEEITVVPNIAMILITGKSRSVDWRQLIRRSFNVVCRLPPALCFSPKARQVLHLKVCSTKMEAFLLFAKMSQEALVTFLQSTYRVLDSWGWREFWPMDAMQKEKTDKKNVMSVNGAIMVDIKTKNSHCECWVSFFSSPFTLTT